MKSDISGSALVRAAAKVVQNQKNAVLGTKNVSKWEVSPGVDAKQPLTDHSLHCSAAMVEEYFLYEIFRHRFLHL